MNDNRSTFKILFGVVIFLFSAAFAFFVAGFLDPTGANSYSMVLFVIGVFYVIIGIAVLRIMAVSLGFLFSADVVILYLLANDFSTYDSFLKIVIVGLSLVAMFYYAWYKLRDNVPDVPASPPGTDSNQAPAAN